jgi:hypothetical protein
MNQPKGEIGQNLRLTSPYKSLFKSGLYGVLPIDLYVYSGWRQVVIVARNL